jgi:hypothetical protein
MPTTLARASRATIAATLIVAACGGGETRHDDTAGGVTDTTRLGAPVGDAKAAMDSGFRAGQERLDSLKAAGVTAAEGVRRTDSAAARALTTDSNATPRIPPVTAEPTPAPATKRP